MADKPEINIVLTPEQTEQIRKQTGKQVQTLKLEALEERLAPGVDLN
jgi:hypothetical protein